MRSVAAALILFTAISAPPLCPAAPADSPEPHLGKAYEALRQEHYETAAAEFRAALHLDPSLTMRARFPLAVALFEMKDWQAARREFDAVRRETGDQPNVAYYLGRIDLAEQNFASAVRNLTRAVARPPFPDTAYYLGLACFRQGDLASAEKWLETAARSNPRDNLVQYQLGLVYRKLGREADAKKAIALSTEIRRQDAEEASLRSECAHRLDLGPREEARAFCRQLYDANDASKLTRLGTLYGQHGDLEAALDPLRRAAELAPQSPQMQYNLAFTYYRLNRFEDARKALAGAERWPDVFPLQSLYGAVLTQLGEYEAACEPLRRAHSLDPQDKRAENLLYAALIAQGVKHQQARLYPEALKSFREAARLRPAVSEPHERMAEIYSLTNRASEAAAEQREAERLHAKE